MLMVGGGDPWWWWWWYRARKGGVTWRRLRGARAWGAAHQDLTSFAVDVGGLLVLGPRPLSQYRTCITGQACQLRSIGGLLLAAGDRVAVMDTCGAALTADSAVVHQAMGAAPASLLAAGSDLLRQAAFAWSAALPAAVGGGYFQLCWCAGGFACEAFESFATQLGGLFVLGPVPARQARTCVSGQTCAVAGASRLKPQSVAAWPPVGRWTQSCHMHVFPR